MKELQGKNGYSYRKSRTGIKKTKKYRNQLKNTQAKNGLGINKLQSAHFCTDVLADLFKNRFA